MKVRKLGTLSKSVLCAFVLVFLIFGTSVQVGLILENHADYSLQEKYQTAASEVMYQDDCGSTYGWSPVSSEASWGGDLLCSSGGLQTGVDLLLSVGRFKSSNIPYVSGPYTHGAMWSKELDLKSRVGEGLDLSVQLEIDYVYGKMGHAYVAIFDQNREAIFVLRLVDAWYGSQSIFGAYYNYLNSEGGGTSPLNTLTVNNDAIQTLRIWYDEPTDKIWSTIGSQSMELTTVSSAEKERWACEIVIAFTNKQHYQYDSKFIRNIALSAEEVYPDCDMDVLVYYDDRTEGWYNSEGYWGNDVVNQIVTDVHHGLHVFYNDQYPNMNFHIYSDWVVHDPNSSGAFDQPLPKLGDYCAKWQEAIGWPRHEKGLNQQYDSTTYFGRLNSTVSNLHGRHFDYLVLMTYNRAGLAGGCNFLRHNAMLLNIAWNQNPNTWAAYGERGIWTLIAHESGHGYGLGHTTNPNDGDVMGNHQRLLPLSRIFNPSHYDDVLSRTTIHDEKFWHQKDDWIDYTTPEYTPPAEMQGYDIFDGVGHSVNTVGITYYPGGYQFMGIFGGADYVADGNGEIKGDGYFFQNDGFYGSFPIDRRYVKAYALEEVSPGVYEIRRTIKVLTHDDPVAVYLLRSFCLDSLTPGQRYYIAFGRSDYWSAEWNLQAEWHSIAIYNPS